VGSGLRENSAQTAHQPQEQQREKEERKEHTGGRWATGRLHLSAPLFLAWLPSVRSVVVPCQCPCPPVCRPPQQQTTPERRWTLRHTS
jgi:hypothetical protein